MAKDVTKAYRGYLAELERECRQTLFTIGAAIVILSASHPLLALIVIPTGILAGLRIYRDARRYIGGVLDRSELLKRALKFDDYDPDLLDTMEMSRLDSYRLDGSLRLRTSALESFWHSYEASCRTFGVDAIGGLRHLLWMGLPLVAMSVGLVAFSSLTTAWNYARVPEGLLPILASLLGLGAATMGKYVIQLALVTSAWDAVVLLPADEPDAGGPLDATGRDEFFSWKLPPAAASPARMARRNGTNP